MPNLDDLPQDFAITDEGDELAAGAGMTAVTRRYVRPPAEDFSEYASVEATVAVGEYESDAVAHQERVIAGWRANGFRFDPVDTATNTYIGTGRLVFLDRSAPQITAAVRVTRRGAIVASVLWGSPTPSANHAAVADLVLRLEPRLVAAAVVWAVPIARPVAPTGPALLQPVVTSAGGTAGGSTGGGTGGSSGCGSRDGPGYRLANGRCASWEDARRGRR